MVGSKRRSSSAKSLPCLPPCRSNLFHAQKGGNRTVYVRALLALSADERRIEDLIQRKTPRKKTIDAQHVLRGLELDGLNAARSGNCWLEPLDCIDQNSVSETAQNGFHCGGDVLRA